MRLVAVHSPHFNNGDMNIIPSLCRPALRFPAPLRAPFVRRAAYSRLSTAIPGGPASLKVTQTPHLAALFQRLPQYRGAASSVSGRPGSQTVEQAAQNVREEVGNSTTDWAKAIAGGNLTVDSVKPSRQTFVSDVLGVNVTTLSVSSSGSRALWRIRCPCPTSCLVFLAAFRMLFLRPRQYTYRTRRASRLQVRRH
jgi:hypothetical protein